MRETKNNEQLRLLKELKKAKGAYKATKLNRTAMRQNDSVQFS